MNVRGLQDDCIAAEVICSRRTVLIPKIPLRPSYSNIAKLCRRDVRSKSWLLRRAVRLKHRLLNVLNYIHHRSSPPPSLDSSMWHFTDPLHLVTSLTQFLNGFDKLQKMTVSLHQVFHIDKCCKVSHIYKINYRWLNILLFVRTTGKN